jgi:hypothetical protein
MDKLFYKDTPDSLDGNGNRKRKCGHVGTITICLH